MAALLFIAIIFGAAFAIIAWEQREPKMPRKESRPIARFGKARI